MASVDIDECRRLAAAWERMKEARRLRDASQDALQSAGYAASVAEAEARFNEAMDAFAEKLLALPT